MGALLLLVLVSIPAHFADADRQLVVGLRSPLHAQPRLAIPIAAADRLDPGLAARCDSLSLRCAGSLADGLPSGAAQPWRSASRRGIDLFAFDPARVVLLEAPDAASVVAARAALAHDPAVEWIEPNRAREPAVWSLAPIGPAVPRTSAGDGSDFPSDPFFRDGRQWGLAGESSAHVRALEAWRRSVGSAEVRLAFADTGIDPAHPELAASLADGSRIERGINVTGEPEAAFADSFGHGTAVVGVMAARTNEGAHFDSLGIAGVCGGDGVANPGCRIVPIRITRGHSGSATSFDIARAILHATMAGGRAMNLSFAGTSPSRIERLALAAAITRGCVVVASSGNHGDTRPGVLDYPAAYAADGLCVAVGASDRQDRRVAFSSWGAGLDLVAPGVDVWTTYMTYPSAFGVVRNGYVAGSGTSFAAPFVTGAIGLLAASRPELLPDDFAPVLRASADDVGPSGADAETGAGRLNVARALASVDRSLGLWHDEVRADRCVRGPTDTLVVSEGGPGGLAAGSFAGTTRLEVTATVAIPDSFLDPVRVWPRLTGTSTVRGDFRIPYLALWAEVASLGLASFTLRGFLYQPADCDTCTPAETVPVPADQARFGFTLIGRIDRAPALSVPAPAEGTPLGAGDSVAVSWLATDPDEVTWIDVVLEGPRTSIRLARARGTTTSVWVHVPCPAPFAGAGTLRITAIDDHGRRRDRTSVGVPIRITGTSCDSVATTPPALAATPNPFRSGVRLSGPNGARIEVLDVAGRTVRSARLDGRLGAFQWDGRDSHGRALDPGLYFVRCDGPRGRTQTKVLKLE